MRYDKHLTVRLDARTHSAIERFARSTMRTRSEVVRFLVKTVLSDWITDSDSRVEVKS